MLKQNILNIETIINLFNYHCAHASQRHKTTIKFDSDAVEAILNPGCSTSISFEFNDFINYRSMKGKVEGLRIHEIRGTGTLKYTVLDDNGDQVNLLIKDAIHVPTMDVRLISLQQVAQQSRDKEAGAVIIAKVCYLKWNGLTKTVPYQAGSNFPILYTLPGRKIARSYTAQYSHAFTLQNNNAYLSKKDKNSTWDKSPIHKLMYPLENETTKSTKLPKSKTKRKKFLKTTNTSIDLSIWGDCGMQEAANVDVIKPKSCKDCEVSFQNLTQPSRILLHYHNKLDHMGFDAMRALACKVFPPKCLIKANTAKCAACQAGKAHIKAASRKGKTIGETIIKPGDLIHMDKPSQLHLIDH